MEAPADNQTANQVKQELEAEERLPVQVNGPVRALRRLEELRPELEACLQPELEKTESPSLEFLRGAMELYHLAQTALTQQLKSKVDRIKEVRRLRVKARRMSIKITKLLGSS